MLNGYLDGEEVFEIGAGDLRNSQPLVLFSLDQAFGFEPRQRFAEWTDTCLVLGLQRAEAEAPGKTPMQDVVLETLVDGLVHRSQ